MNSGCRRFPEPFPELHEFLTTDFTLLGADHRQFAIECQVDNPIRLENDLLWLGCPELFADEIGRLYEHVKPSMPRYYLYPSHIVFNPAEVTAQLQMKAAEEVERFIQLP